MRKKSYMDKSNILTEQYFNASQRLEEGFLKSLAGFVKKEGVLVTTLASPVGFFFNMVRRLIAHQFLYHLN